MISDLIFARSAKKIRLLGKTLPERVKLRRDLIIVLCLEKKNLPPLERV